MDYYIYENGQLINTIVADEAFVTSYCKDNGYTYEAVDPTPEPEPEPTDTEVLNTLLGVTANE